MQPLWQSIETLRGGVNTDMIQSFDSMILEFIQTDLRSDFLDTTMPYITRLGNGGLIWIIAALAFLKSSLYRTDGMLLAGTLLSCVFIGNLILKPIVRRIRPCGNDATVPLLIRRPKDYSFPSGHTMSSFAAAVVIFHASLVMGIAAYLVASLIAFSRLYLYVHYPSDIIVGIILGSAISTAVIFL